MFQKNKNAQNFVKKTKDNFSGFYNKVVNNYVEKKQNKSSFFENFSNYVKDVRDKFGESEMINYTKDFFDSNSIISKFVFLIFVLICFFLLLKLFISIIFFSVKKSRSPFLISGLINGNNYYMIDQDPAKSNSVTIYRSNNEQSGIEFTWSVWLNINRVGNDTTKYQHIFSKGGNGTVNADGIMAINNSPGVYILPNQNTIRIMMNTVSTEPKYITEQLDVPNIPLGKWFHLAIRMQNKIMDVYINGVITKRLSFLNVPKQNYDNVFVCANGGFDGDLSDLRYFDKALNIFEINDILGRGPNMKSKSKKTYNFDYLSSSWYM